MSESSTQNTCRYHCVRCAKHFKSLVAFDEHIERPGVHRSPAECGRLRVQRVGACRVHPDQHEDDVDLWEYHFVPDETKPRYLQEEDLD